VPDLALRGGAVGISVLREDLNVKHVFFACPSENSYTAGIRTDRVQATQTISSCVI